MLNYYQKGGGLRNFNYSSTKFQDLDFLEMKFLVSDVESIGGGVL
jgi:hypothetical protein